MTNTYNTGNPLGSTDARDLYDNASNMDEGMNSGTPAFTDRLGVLRKTWNGMEAEFGLAQTGRASEFDTAQSARETEFQDFLVASGFTSLGNYAAGLNFTLYNQYMARDGFFYRPAPSSIPFTTTGTWVGGDENLFVLLSPDDVLRQDLANATDPAKGSSLVGHSGGTVADALNGLTTISPLQYGAVGDGVADDTAALVAMYADAVSLPAAIVDYSGNIYRYISQIVVSGDVTIRGNCTFFGDNAGTTIHGSLTDIGNISAAATIGDDQFTASSVAGLAENDLLILHNFVASSYSPHRTNYYDGEYVRVSTVVGSVVNVQGNLLTSYTGVATDKIFKVNSIAVDIDGVEFTGGDFYTLLIKYADGARINLKRVSNTKNDAASVAAIGFDKCYNTTVDGGRFERPYVALANTNYGIVFLNCQRARVVGADVFGGRHAVSTGGDAQNGAVPNRYIHIEDSVLKNDPASAVYCADFHGNTIDSHYKNCEVYGRFGLAGENVYAIRCSVWSEPGIDRPPLGYHELVGGDLGFIDCKAYVGEGSTAAHIVSNLGSGLTANISKPYKIFATGLEARLNAAVIGIINAFENSGEVNSWFLDDFDVSGVTSGLTRFITYSLVAPGIEPAAVETTRPRYPVLEAFTPIVRSGATLTATRVKFYPVSGSNANGKFRKLEDGTMTCAHNFVIASTAISTAFLTDAFRTGLINWTFPAAFADEPDTTGIAANGSAMGIVESTSSTTTFGFFFVANTSQAAATREAKLVANGRWGLA